MIRLGVVQWKIVHNIYPSNILLSKMKVKENDKCSYCTDVTADVTEQLVFFRMSGCEAFVEF